MEKLELANKEQIEIQSGASESSLSVEVKRVDDFKTLYEKFTEDNLKEVTFLNEAGVICAIYKDKILASAKLETVTDVETEENKLIATFNLKDIDSTAKRIKYLEETVDTLRLNSLEVE